jgi:hypothetical protein
MSSVAAPLCRPRLHRAAPFWHRKAAEAAGDWRRAPGSATLAVGGTELRRGEDAMIGGAAYVDIGVAGERIAATAG